MKVQADKHRYERNFQVNDWVWLKLQPYRQQTLQARVNQKIAPKFYGPFQIIATIGKVAYKRRLPSSTNIHDVFHVSQLKSFHGPLPLTVTLPSLMRNVVTPKIPQSIISRRIKNINNATQVQFLVQWSGLP